MRYYFALVHQEPGSAYGVQFPDVAGLFSAADDDNAIVPNAIEALYQFAEDAEVPEPSSLNDIVNIPSVRQALAQGAYLITIPLINNDTAEITRVSVPTNADESYQEAMMNEWRNRLQEMVASDGRSLRAISKAAGYGENYVQQMLKDKKQPSFPRLAKVLSVLGSAATLYVTSGLRLTPDAERYLRLVMTLDKRER